MCFAPQWRALFRHLNFQKWSGPGVFCTFRLGFFHIATSKSGLSMVCFVHFDLEMCFASQRCALFRHRNFQKTLWSHKPEEKHSVSRLSYLFAHLHLFSSDSFSSDLLSSNLSLLSASALLSFSSVHIVGSLTSKLPSIIINSFFM